MHSHKKWLGNELKKIAEPSLFSAGPFFPPEKCLQIIGKKGGKTLSDKEKMSIFVALLFLCVRKH